MPGNFYDGTDSQLYTGSAAFSTKITATPTAFGLVAGQATAYSGLNSAFSSAYLLAIDPVTRTKGAVSAKNVAKGNLKTMASNLAKIIDGTPAVTDAQKITLGLNVRATPTPIPPPSSAPAIDIVSAIGRTVTIRLHDSTDTTKRGKPALVNGACVYSFVGATPPAATTGWTFEGVTSRTVVPVQFPTTVAGGAQVWFTAFWFNERKQNGPASDPVASYLPGGSVSMAA